MRNADFVIDLSDNSFRNINTEAMIFDVIKHFQENQSYNKMVKSDLMILEYKCPIDVDKIQVRLEWNFITYVISGKKDWIAGGNVYTVKDGDSIFIRKGVYTLRQYFDIDHCVIAFFIHDDFIRNFMRENPEIRIPQHNDPIDQQIYPLEVDHALESLFYSIYTYLKMGRDMPKNLVELKFKELLFNILLNPRHSKLVQLFGSLNQTGKAALDDVMLKNFQYDLQLEEFARLCGRSLSAFKRDFKSAYQASPARWINDKRLDYARSLLVSSDMNVNDVCYESGFKNPSHFNKIFKDKFGSSPGQFRMAGAESEMQ